MKRDSPVSFAGGDFALRPEDSRAVCHLSSTGRQRRRVLGVPSSWSGDGIKDP